MSKLPAPRVEPLESRQLLSAGQLDPAFNSGGFIEDTHQPVATGVGVTSDGKVVVAGTNNGNFEITRYNANGSLDTTFGGGTGQVISDFGGNDQVGGLVIQKDGRIIVAGTSNIGGQAAEDVIVARYTTSGALDTTFSHDGLAAAFFGGSGSANDVALAADGSIITAGTLIDGQSGGSDMLLVRFSSRGTLDTSFGRSGAAITGLGGTHQALGLAIQSDGRIIAAGTAGRAGSTTAILERFNTSGQLENTPFTITSVTHVDSFNSVVVQADGKIVAAGRSGSTGVLARFATFGGNDPTFGNNGIVTATVGTGGFTDVKQQADGKLVVGGFVDTLNGTSNDFIVSRYLSTGAIDTTFGLKGITTTDFGGDDRINRIALQSDGAVVAAGAADSHLAVARYQPDAPPVPTVTLLSALRLRHSAATYSFSVAYFSGAGINTSTIDSNDIVVTGPHGYRKVATLVSDVRGRNRSIRIVTYSVPGPNGAWTAADNGVYTITLQPNQVRDNRGLEVIAQKVGAFSVVIGT